MKSLLFSSILTFAAVAALAADTPSFNGRWKIHSSVSGTESDTECTFTQKDDTLTGSCTTDKDERAASGKVDGLKAEWSYDSEYNGTALTVKYSGTLDSAAAEISGTLSVTPFNVDGDFTATQTK